MGTRLLLAVTDPLTAKVLLVGQLSSLQEAGFEVGLAVGAGSGLEEVAEREQVRVFPIPMERDARPVKDLQSLRSMGRVIRSFDPQIVCAGTPKAGLLGMIAAARYRVGVRVYTLRGLRLETSRGLLAYVLSATERLAARCAHHVVCTSHSLRQRAVELQLVRSDKAIVLGPGSSNGVDVERFRPTAETERTFAREELGIPVGSPVVGFVGRLTRDKGIVDLSSAFFEDVLPRLPNCRLVLAGSFETGDPVPNEVRRRLYDDPRVILMGHMEKPESVYRAIDVLAFPSYREGFPNAPLEAAASGVPVAGYEATGTVDAVLDGLTGSLVGVGDQSDLAAALIQYMVNPELGSAHGTAGRRRAVAEFRRESIWRLWIDFYRECSLGRKSG